MIEPTPQEVTEYAKSIGFNLNGEKFCAYYESIGWMIGKRPMKSWRGAVRTWKIREQESSMGRKILEDLSSKMPPVA